MKDRTGSVTGIAQYNERVSISISAKVEDTTPFAGLLATSLTVVNAIPDHLKNGVVGGTVLINSISVSKEAEDYNSIEIKATYYPDIT